MSTPIELAYPLRGPVLVQNSPADRVPSHGTHAFATGYAIDLTPLDAGGRSASVRLRTWVRPEPPDRFVGFGRPVLAPVAGTVVGTHDGEADHHAYRGLPSIGYALTQGRRVAAGWLGLAGNHVMVRTAAGAIVAVCHLRRGSLAVRPGDQVTLGQELGRCGNSGNSTEPHVHLQAMDGTDPERAAALPIRFPDGLPRNGSVVDLG